MLDTVAPVVKLERPVQHVAPALGIDPTLSRSGSSYVRGPLCRPFWLPPASHLVRLLKTAFDSRGLKNAANSLTDSDGTESFLTVLASVLDALGMPATAFLSRDGKGEGPSEQSSLCRAQGLSVKNRARLGGATQRQA